MKRTICFILAVAILLSCKNKNQKQKIDAHIHYQSVLSEIQMEWIEKTLSELSVEEMAAQVIMRWSPGSFTPVESDDFERDIELIENGLGGIWFMAGSPNERAAKANAFQKHAKVPLLIMGSEGLGKKFLRVSEPGRLFRGGGTDLPSAMAYGAIGDPAMVRESARIHGREVRAVGSHMGNPEAAVLLDLDNVLHNRCFSDDPQLIAALCSAFIYGLHDSGALAITGFYPGAGNIGKDPHVDLPVMPGDRESFDSIHFVPIRAAIEAGTDLLITSHIGVPGLTGQDSLPATMSPEVFRILREELKFDGVVMTDAMGMGAIANKYDLTEASVLAFKAGHDIILGPPSKKLADTLARLVHNGDIPLKRLRTSVRRILELKAKLGLNTERMVNMDEVNTLVGSRDYQKFADSAASRSIVLLRNGNGVLPLEDLTQKKILSISYARETRTAENLSAGEEFNGTLQRLVKTIKNFKISPSTEPNVYQDLMAESADTDLVILSIYLRPELGTNVQEEISDSLVQFMDAIKKKGKKIIVVSFGELEVLNYMPDLGTFMMAWSGQDVMQRAAAKAIAGIKPISGKLPLDLLPYHSKGDGIILGNTK